MKNLTEQEIRAIVQDELRKNYLSGVPRIDPHEHNGDDSFAINPANLIGWSPIPTTTQTYTNELTGLQEYGFGSPQQLEGGNVYGQNQFLNNPTISQYPIPIVTGFGVGVTGAFNAGWAPEGTLVYFNNSTLNGLYIRIEGIWRGVNLNLTA